MVLKFCSGFFATTAEAAVSPVDGEKNEFRKNALDAMLLDPQQDAKWEKEFRVFFDGSKPIGLGFQPAASLLMKQSPRQDPSSLGHCRGESDYVDKYECVVEEIAPKSAAAEYNARCRAIGDYSRLVDKELRVRKVNNEDAAGVPYDDVLQMMRDAMPAFFLTFADVHSKRVRLQDTSENLKSRSVRRRQSSMTLGSGAVLIRRNSSVSLRNPGVPTTGSGVVAGTRLMARRNSSSVVLMHGGAADVQANTALVSDLENKTESVNQQLQSLKQQIAELERERDQVVQDKEVLVNERNSIATTKEELQSEKLKLREDRDAIIAKNKLLTSQRQSASDLRSSALEQEQRGESKLKTELEDARNELLLLQQEHSELVNAQDRLREKLAEQMRVVEENAGLSEQLRHEKDALESQWKELRLEHTDTAHHVEELHSRLVEAQEKCRDAEIQLYSLHEELEVKIKQLSGLTQAIEAIRLDNSELERLLRQRRRSHLSSASEGHEDSLTSLKRLLDECAAIEKHRDELLAESSCYEQKMHAYQDEIDSLTSKNVEHSQQIASSENEIQVAQDRQQVLRTEFENQQQIVQQNSSSTQEELQQRIQVLEKCCAAEKAEKEQLRAALDRLEESARAKLEAHAKEQEFLSQFKLQMMNGIVVTKYGTRGNPHARVLFSDPGCRWISWKQPSSSVSLVSPRADAKVETNDLVEVISGATTEVFLRQKPETPTKCFSLVFVHPCRTLDIEADTVERCQFYLRGFRLLHEEASQKRR